MSKTLLVAFLLGAALLISGSRAKPAGDYTSAAERSESEAREYDALAERYRRQPTADEWKNPMTGRTAGHAAQMAGILWRKAEKMRRLAKAGPQ